MTTSARTASAPYQIKGKTVEIRSFPFAVKSIDKDQGLVTGYLSTFGNTDLQQDQVMPGAFKKTLLDALGRVKAGRKYLFAMLWMHDPEQPIGGFVSAQEDSHGLLVTAQLDITTNSAGMSNNPQAVKVFSGYRQGYVDEMSIGYIVIQKAYQGPIRQLKEVQLIEGSAVTMLFAANPEALVPAAGVKSVRATRSSLPSQHEVKGLASGKTTWPLAPRTTPWDAGQATKDIEKWADGDWAKVAQCFFWVAHNPPTKLADCKLPFVALVDGNMQAVPEGIISCAGVLQGAMGGVDLPSGDVAAVKARIAHYYTKLDMTPPWEQSSSNGDAAKRRSLVPFSSSSHSSSSPSSKDFNDRYRQQQIASWLADLDGWYDALKEALIDMFLIGDSPQTDVLDTVLNESQDNKIAAIPALEEWVQRGIDLDVSNYITDDAAEDVYQQFLWNYGGWSSYGCNARSDVIAQKAGRAISAATQATLEQHQADARALLDQHAAAADTLAAQVKDMVADHVSAMQQKVSDLTQLWQEEGQGPAYTNDKTRFASSSSSPRTRREPPTPALARSDTQPRNTRTALEESTLTLADLEAVL